MTNVVISTIGTSLLTQQIDRSHPDEKTWYSRLRDTANLRLENTPEDVLDIITQLTARGKAKLQNLNVSGIRQASAELNGIYGLYANNLDNGRQDMHWLIATDTAQGLETAEIVKEFLMAKGISSEVYAPPGLSTASTEAFSDGIDDLLTKLEEITNVNGKVIFNLVGGFKSIQGYLNTIGMFYADEIIYIFEGEKSELIKIPRLPIKVDLETIEPYKVQFALMANGGEINRGQVPNISETLIYGVDDEVTLTNWGKLTWNKIKGEILSGELLQFPYIKYRDSFIKDYGSISNPSEKVKVQEVLAKVSYLMQKTNGDRSVLRREGGIQYETYKNTAIDHFRVNLAMRISCTPEPDKSLSMRFYGTHDHVEGGEKIK